MERKRSEKGLKKTKKSLWWAGAFGATIGIIAFAPIWAIHGGEYIDLGDYFSQYVPFIKELKRMIKSGSLAWSWNSCLGDSFIGAYSYYTVFNPFAWLVAAFPDKYILYGTMLATILKFSVSMVAATLYMSRFCKKDIYAVIGSMLYTFSGLTLVNTYFYFFLDISAVFPFVLCGLEQLIVEKKRTMYIIALMFNAMINYYFFVSTVLIIVIYVVFRLELYKIASWKRNVKTFGDIVISSFIGTGMAGIALIPAIYTILGSGKAMENIGANVILMYWPQNILERIRTFVAPIESGQYRAFFDGSIWSSTGLYLPVFGCTLVIQRCIKKRDWLKKICIFFSICYFVPVLNAAFNLYSSATYTRWLYSLVLLFSLSTVLVLEEIENKMQVFNKKLILCVSIFAMILQIFPLIIYFMYRGGINLLNRFASVCITEYFMGYSYIIVMLILTIGNYIILGYIAMSQVYNPKRIFLCVVIGCCLNFITYNVINYVIHVQEENLEYYYQKSMVEGYENKGNIFEYRVDHSGKIANYGLFKNMPSVSYFNSLQNPKTSYFAYAVGIGENSWDISLSTPALGKEYVNALLSVKYYYDYDGDYAIPEGFDYLKTENFVDIYENQNYIPIGFTYDTFCLEKDLTDMQPEERAKAMLSALCVKEKDRKIASRYLRYKMNIDDTKDISQLVAERNEQNCNYFKGTSKGFETEIDLESAEILFLSIPNDTGWKIRINGERAEIIDVNFGLLGICCKSGKNIISATYHTPGWIYGIVCSGIFILLWIIYELNFKQALFINYYQAVGIEKIEAEYRGQTDDRFVDTIEETSSETP